MMWKYFSKFWSSATVETKGEMADEEAFKVPDDTLGIHVLYEPNDGTIEPDVDIIAVHGLGGDSFSTWTQQSSKTLWLRDRLPNANLFKNARVMTFGYDARAFVHPFAQSTRGRTFTFAEDLLNDVSDKRASSPLAKRRPIIFLGHSLGGIVIKSALVHAHALSGQYGDILEATKAIVFFGTPHQGSDSATWMVYLGGLSRGLGVESTKVIHELERWSDPLVELTTVFSELAPRFLISTFFEQQKTNGVLVVPEASARMGQKNERTVGINADHRRICKFGEAHDANYSRVLARLVATLTAFKEGNTIPEKIPDAVDPEGEEDEALQERFKALRN